MRRSQQPHKSSRTTGSSSRSSSWDPVPVDPVTETPAATAPASPGSTTAGPAIAGAGSRRLREARNYLAFIPFLAYVGLFLIVPTLIVAIGSVTSNQGGFTLEYIS